ncbi:hypothetical protein [Nonlabens antarcticus]|uniref:hypothetical protein n=1 Tax=Nonlabens antarcticus TaxID=392714 RepID=UPI001891E2BF|nr:hypothetical protein [Nonlabens antarcticus]
MLANEKEKRNIVLSPLLLLVGIYCLLAQNILLKGQFETFRFSQNSYIYDYGILISKGMVYLAFALSFMFPLIIWINKKHSLKKKILLTIVGSLPALYFILLYSLSS